MIGVNVGTTTPRCYWIMRLYSIILTAKAFQPLWSLLRLQKSKTTKSKGHKQLQATGVQEVKNIVKKQKKSKVSERAYMIN